MVEIGEFRLWLVVFLALSYAPGAPAQDEPPSERPGIPVVGRPLTDFYGGAGTGVQVIADADPKVLTTNEWLGYSLTITKLMNPADVEKPSLKALSDFAPFQIDESSALDPPIESQHPNQRVFRYRLRPSAPTVTMIPEVVFCYFDPRRIVAPNRPQDRFPKALSNPVSIHVTAPVEQPVQPVPLLIPEFAERFAPVSELVSNDNTSSRLPPEFALVLIMAPLGALAYAALWTRCFPDAAKLRRLRRHRSVRKALDSLAAIREASPRAVAEQVVKILLIYLEERFDMPSGWGTSTEIVAFLQSSQSSPAAIQQSRELFDLLDASRFGRDFGTETNLREEAERLLMTLEGAA